MYLQCRRIYIEISGTIQNSQIWQGNDWRNSSITHRYPPCYIVHAKDDSTVPCKNSTELKKLLDKHHIPVKLELIEHGEHGWGDGSGTEAAGWPDRAAAFMEQLV